MPEVEAASTPPEPSPNDLIRQLRTSLDSRKISGVPSDQADAFKANYLELKKGFGEDDERTKQAFKKWKDAQKNGRLERLEREACAFGEYLGKKDEYDRRLAAFANRPPEKLSDAEEIRRFQILLGNLPVRVVRAKIPNIDRFIKANKDKLNLRKHGLDLKKFGDSEVSSLFGRLTKATLKGEPAAAEARAGKPAEPAKAVEQPPELAKKYQELASLIRQQKELEQRQHEMDTQAFENFKQTDEYKSIPEEQKPNLLKFITSFSEKYETGDEYTKLKKELGEVGVAIAEKERDIIPEIDKRTARELKISIDDIKAIPESDQFKHGQCEGLFQDLSSALLDYETALQLGDETIVSQTKDELQEACKEFEEYMQKGKPDYKAPEFNQFLEQLAKDFVVERPEPAPEVRPALAKTDYDHWEDMGASLSPEGYFERQKYKGHVEAAGELLEALKQAEEIKTLVNQTRQKAEQAGRVYPEEIRDDLALIALIKDRIVNTSYYAGQKADDPARQAFAKFRAENPKARFDNGDWLMALDYLDYDLRVEHNKRVIAEYKRPRPGRREVQPEVGRRGDQLVRLEEPVSLMKAEKAGMTDNFLKDYQIFQVVKSHLMPAELKRKVALLREGKLEGAGTHEEQKRKAVQESFDFDRKLLMALEFADPGSLERAIRLQAASAEQQRRLSDEMTALRKQFDNLEQRIIEEGFEEVALEYEGLTPEETEVGRKAIKRRLKTRIKSVDAGEVRHRCFKILQNRLWREMYFPSERLVEVPGKIHEKKLVQVTERGRPKVEKPPEEVSAAAKANADKEEVAGVEPKVEAEKPPEEVEKEKEKGVEKEEIEFKLPEKIKAALVAGKARIERELKGKSLTAREAIEFEAAQMARLLMEEQRRKWEMKGKPLGEKLKVLGERIWKNIGEWPAYSKEKLHTMKLFAAGGIEGKLPYELFEMIDDEARRRLQGERTAMSKWQKFKRGLGDFWKEVTFSEKDIHAKRVEVMRETRAAFEADTDNIDTSLSAEMQAIKRAYRDVVLGNWAESDALAARIAETSLEETCHVALGEKRLAGIEIGRDTEFGKFLNQNVLRPLIQAALEDPTGGISTKREAEVRKELENYMFSGEFRTWRDSLSEEQKSKLDESLLYTNNIIDVCKTEIIPVVLTAKEHDQVMGDIDIDIELTLGTAKWGPRGKVETTWVEERCNTNQDIWKELRKRGDWGRQAVNEEVLQPATRRERRIAAFADLGGRREILWGAGFAGATMLVRTPLSALAKANLGPIGGYLTYTFAPIAVGSAAAGVMAGLKERARLNREYGQDNIERALNYQFPQDATRRAKMECFQLHMIDMAERTADLNDLTTQELDRDSALKLLGLLADSNARVAISDKNSDLRGANLLRSSTPLSYIDESKDFDFSRGKVKNKLRDSLAANDALRAEVIDALGETEDDLKDPDNPDSKEAVVDKLILKLQSQMESNIEKGIETPVEYQLVLGEVSLEKAQSIKAKEKAFGWYKTKRSVAVGAVTAGFSFAAGTVANQAVHTLSGRPGGAIEVLYHGIKGDKAWFEAMSAVAMPGVSGKAELIHNPKTGQEGILRLSDNLDIKNGNLVDNKGNILVFGFSDKVGFTPQGELDAQTLDMIQKVSLGFEHRLDAISLSGNTHTVSIGGEQFVLPKEVQIGDINNDGVADLYYDLRGVGLGKVAIDTSGADLSDPGTLSDILKDHGFTSIPGKEEVLVFPVSPTHQGSEETLKTIVDAHGKPHEIKMAIPEGTHLKETKPGVFDLVADKNNARIAQFEVDKTGQAHLLSAEKGVSLGNTDEGFIVSGQREVTTGTKALTPTEFVTKYKGKVVEWSRGPYYGQDTPGVYDYNELRVHWGGVAGTGFDAKGNVVIDIGKMTPDGSWTGLDKVDITQLTKEGKMFVGLELFDQDRKWIVPVEINTDGKAVITPGNKLAYSLFEKGADGKAVFKGPAFGIAFEHPKGGSGIVSSVVGTGEWQPPVEQVTETVDLKTPIFEPTLTVPELKIGAPTEFTPQPIYENVVCIPEGVARELPTPFPIPIPWPRRPLEASEGAVERIRDRESLSGYYGSGYFAWLTPEKEAYYRSRLSKRLLINPEINLNPTVEIPEYFERQSPEYMERLEAYLSQGGMSEPADEECDAFVCVPIYTLGEGKIVEAALEQYLLQIDKDKNKQAINPRKFEIIIYLNHPKPKLEELESKLGHSIYDGVEERVRAGKPEAYDTEEVIRQFMEKHPGLRIRIMEEEFDQRQKWSHIIRPLYDVAMLRAMRRKEPFKRDPLIVTNDVDIVAMSPIYIRDILKRMDMNEVAAWRDPSVRKIDGLTGRVDMEKKVYPNFPGFLAAQRIYHFLEQQRGTRHNRSTHGRNTILRGSMYAAMGGVNLEMDDGADGELGLMVAVARKAVNTIPPLPAVWLETDPRREIDSWKKGIPLVYNWSNWAAMNLYGVDWKEKFDEPPQDPSKLDKASLERDINAIVLEWSGGKVSNQLIRALNFVGLRNHQAQIDVLHWYGASADSERMQSLLRACKLEPENYHLEDGRIVIDKKEGHMDYHFEYGTDSKGRAITKVVIDDLSNLHRNLDTYIREQRWKVTEGKVKEATSHPPISHVVDNFYAEYLDYQEFNSIFGEIFISEDYPWQPDPSNLTPKIIDLGSHIGMSVLWWKHLAPGAKITAVEANPETAELLERNIKRNDLENVEVVKAAVSSKDGDVDLFLPKPGVDFRWGDFVSGTPKDPDKYDKVSVSSVRLSSLITEPADVLKVDIEGLELDVLREAESKLALVKEVMVEFHNDPDNPENSLDETIDLLQKQGYQLTAAHKGRPIDLATVDRSQKISINIHARRSVRDEDIRITKPPEPFAPSEVKLAPPPRPVGVAAPTVHLVTAEQLKVKWDGKEKEFTVPTPFKTWLETKDIEAKDIKVIDAYKVKLEVVDAQILALNDQPVDKDHLAKVLRGELGDFNRWDTIESVAEVPDVTYRVLNIPFQTKDGRVIVLRTVNDQYDLIQKILLTPEQKKALVKGRLDIQGAPKIETSDNKYLPSEYAETAVIIDGKRHEVQAASNVGPIREIDEDYMVFAQGLVSADVEKDKISWSLQGIADGMGGHGDGNIASRVGAKEIVKVFKGLHLRKEGTFEYVFKADEGEKRESVGKKIEEIVSFARRKAAEAIREKTARGNTTFAAVLTWGNKQFILKAGDSRVYKRRKDVSLEQIGKDHSLVQRLLDLGHITEEEANAHLQKNLIYQTLRDDEIELIEVEGLQEGEGYLICCDGVPGAFGRPYSRQIEMEQVLTRAIEVGENAAVALVEARLNLADDNLSALVVLPAEEKRKPAKAEVVSQAELKEKIDQIE